MVRQFLSHVIGNISRFNAIQTWKYWQIFWSERNQKIEIFLAIKSIFLKALIQSTKNHDNNDSSQQNKIARSKNETQFVHL